MTYNLHQAPHTFLAARAKRRDDAVIANPRGEGFVRNLKFAGIDTETRQRSRRPQTAQRAFKRLLRPQSLNRDVSATTGQTFYFRDYIDVSIIERDVCAHSFRHRQAVLVAVDADDQRGSH